MLSREQGAPNDPFTDSNIHLPKQPKLKISNLAPYLTQIQRRKKQRSYLQRSKKTIHQSSSKSFRIKDKSVTSLQKQLFSKAREAVANKTGTNQVTRKRNESPSQQYELNRQRRQRRTQSVNRHHEIEFSKTIEHDRPTANNFFNQLYAKVKHKMENGKSQSRNNITIQHHEKRQTQQTKKARRGRFQALGDHRARSEQAGELNMYKISYTNATHNPPDVRQVSRKNSQDQQRSIDAKKKNNFRRNKYEAASQEIERKESNLQMSLNLEMDRLAARQNEAFTQARKRQLHGSIEKSTEKYFKFQSYRPVRSKNEIQIYVSTVPNPSLQKASKSTNQRSDCHKNTLHLAKHSATNNANSKKQTELYEYDFDFQNEEALIEAQGEGGSEFEPDQSIVLPNKEIDQFEKQRKQVELDFFTKEEARLDWSEDQCKIDDI